MDTDNQITSLKDQGNTHFKDGNFENALDCYSLAIKMGPTQKSDLAVLYKNRAAVHLKKHDFKAAEADATLSLELVPTDAKALFRRCQAREALEKFSDAFTDAKQALHLEPQNQALIETLRKLHELMQQKQKEAMSTENRVKNMFSIAFGQNAEDEKRLTAMNNLLVLARENAGAELIYHSDGVAKLLQVIESGRGNETELVLAAQRVLDELARNESRALKLLAALTVEKVVWLINTKNQEVSDAASLLVQRAINALSGMDRKENRKPNEEMCEKNKIVLIDLIFELKRMLTDPSVGAVARDNAICLLLKNLMHMDWGLPRGCSWKFVENDGLERLLKVACNIPEKSCLPISKDTRDNLAVCLARLYDDMVFDKYRQMYNEIIDRFIQEKMKEIGKHPEYKIEVCACITTLLLGPFEIGIRLAGDQATTTMMFNMACSEDLLQQSVAVEAIVNTASKRDRCSVIIAQGVPILNQLYKSKDDHIKARALVGLCKCASSHGTDISRREMVEGSNLKLADACKRFLLNPQKDIDLRRWAAEGLSYLTVDADVKEWLIADPKAIQVVVDLAKQAGPLCVFGVASMFVNLTNTYDMPKAEAELVKLAQFAKHHVPEEHPKDKEEFVKKRIATLVKEGATSACVALSKTESAQSRELLSRSLCAFVQDKDHRGQVVQEGGAKVLISLATNGTEAGRTHAANALAKIGVTINPEIAFPGQRVYEVIKPLVALLDVEKSGLQNYEALLALTNLSSVSDSVRARIFKEKVLPKIEEYWFMQEHAELRAAAAECLMNMLHYKDCMEATIAPGTDRLKLWVLYCSEEDERLQKAATASVALITESPEACKRIVEEIPAWADVFKEASMCDSITSQIRILRAIRNIMSHSVDMAARVMQTDIFNVLVAITKLDDEKRKECQKTALEALKMAEKWELIKATDRELHERTTGLSTIRLD